MGEIDDACRAVVEGVDGALACGVVDLQTGMLLGIHTSAEHGRSMDEIVAAATTDLFLGPNVGRIQQLVGAHAGKPGAGAPCFQEIHITSEGRFHFAKAVKDDQAVIMLVTQKTTNIGMGWAELKRSIPIVEPLVP